MRPASGPRDRAALAQLGDLALGELRVRTMRELLQVELVVFRVLAFLDRAPELDLDFLRSARGARRCRRLRRRRPRLGGPRRHGARRRRTHHRLVVLVLGGLALEHALQRAAEIARALVARLGRLCQRPADDAVELGRQRAVDLRGPHRLVVHDHLAQRPVASRERPLVGEELVQHDAGGEEIRAVVDRQPLHLLRRHVGGRPHHGAHLGAVGAVRVLDLRHAEVHQLRAALPVEHDVGRLDVAVDDAGLVRVVERAQELAHEAHELPGLEAQVVVEAVLEVLAADELHDDEGDVALLAEIVDLDDVRMIEARDRLRLLLEPDRILARHLFVEVALDDGLDRDRAVQLRVERLVHHAHRPAADLALQLVAA